MQQDIYDPLNEYVNVFQPRFRDIATSTFASLASEARVDVEANRSTCKELDETEKSIDSVKSRAEAWNGFCVLLWLIVAACAGFTIYALSQEMEVEPRVWAVVSVAAAVALPLLIFLVHPKIKKLGAERATLEEKAKELRQEAWRQMEPLNRLYDWDVLTRMMTQTVPRLEFDPYFTTERLADLRNVYGWDDVFNEQRSVVYAHSGLINGNPFIICRTRTMQMGTKTYYGTKVIHWTTTERGADGKYHTVHHTQTLTASVTANFPRYYEMTRLFYGNTAAPDLRFNRTKSGLAGKEGSFSFKSERRALRKKARDLKNSDFAMLTNEDFEVAFNTSDRNNNQQFALLFTPLAQESMLALLKDQKAGYGDDFDFHKFGMINMIVSDHMQKLNLDTNPARYRSHSYDKAQADFIAINEQLFRAIYFALAPLLCVPMYQQIRPAHEIYGHDMPRHSAFWEHEALANFWGFEHFKHPSCATNCILKTEQSVRRGDRSTITVLAYGYRIKKRVTFVSVWGGDGRLHEVPVPWDEYLPVTGKGQMEIREDNTSEADNATTQKQRLSSIHSLLQAENLSLYRRHIASRV